MSPSGYLLFVNTSPKGVPDETWTKWWVSQHVQTLKTAKEQKACSRVALYKEVGFSLLPKPDHPLRFLALYETNNDQLQNNEAFTPTSPEENSDTRNYKLIQDYNPRKLSTGQWRASMYRDNGFKKSYGL